MCRLVLLSRLQFVQCLCILFLFYLTVLIACMICFDYNVCDCHAFIKGNLLTYLLANTGSGPVRYGTAPRVAAFTPNPAVRRRAGSCRAGFGVKEILTLKLHWFDLLKICCGLLVQLVQWSVSMTTPYT